MPTAGTPLPNNLGYGLGWITEDYHGNKLVAHNGAINGFYSYVTLVPAPKDGVVLLTNIEPGNGGETFAEAARLRLVNWLLGVPSEPDLTGAVNKQYGADPAQLKANLQAARTYQADPAALAALSGDYPGPNGVLTVTPRDGKLYAKFEGQPAEGELIPFAPGDFLLNTYPAAGVVVRFQTDAQGTITVYQQGVQIAQRLGPGVQLPEYKDPQGRFSVVLPQGLSQQQQGDHVLLTSANPPAAVILMALDAGSNPLRTNVAQFLRRRDATFNQDPVSATDTPPINGVVWTQFLYVLPGEQLLAVLATQQNGTMYLILLQAKQAYIAALTPLVQSLLLAYKIGATGPTAPAPTQVPGMPRTGHPTEPGLLSAPVAVLLASLLLVVGWMLRRRALVRTLG